MNYKNQWILFISVMVIGFGCKKESNPDKIIAGDQSKIWQTEKQTNAEGKKVETDEPKEKESMQFYSNGDFVVNGANEGAKGKWDYEANTKNLSLQFDGAGVSENFSVLDLDEDEIKLKSDDGSTLLLKSK